MGYRSEWKLAINTSGVDKLNEFLNWAKAYSLTGTPKAQTMEFILNNAMDNDDSYILFGEGCTKCYDPWDAVINDVFEYCENAPEFFDCAYARCGEETSDNEVRNGNKLYIGISRSIDSVDFPDFTPGEKVEKEEVKPTKQEEKCGCGKMKDLGLPCWWCGKVG